METDMELSNGAAKIIKCDARSVTEINKVVLRSLSNSIGGTRISRKDELLEIGTSFVSTRKQSCLLWQMICPSLGGILIWRALAVIYACCSSPIWRGWCQEMTELCTSPPHDWWPQGGLFTSPPVCPLVGKGCTGGGWLWCEMMRRDTLGCTVEPKQHEYNNSALIRMELLLSFAVSWLNPTSSNGPHGFELKECSMQWIFAIFLAMIATLRLTVTVISRSVFACNLQN